MNYILLIALFVIWTGIIWILAVGSTRMRLDAEAVERRAEIEMIMRMKKTDVVARRYMLPKQGGYVAFDTNHN